MSFKLKIDVVDNVLQAVGTVSELNDLIIGKGNHELALNTLAANCCQCAETYIVDAVLAVHHCGNGKSGVDAAEQALADVAYGDSDCIECSALACDDLSAGLSCVFLDLSVINNGTLALGEAVDVLVDGDTGNVCDGPGNERGIAVLTEYVSVNVLLADIEGLGKTGTQTSGIEGCAGTDDLVGGETRVLVEYVGEDIDRIAYYDINSLRSVLDDLGDYGLGDVNVYLSKFKTRLTCFSGHTGCKDNDVGTLCIGICACVDGYGGTERNTLEDIHCFALSLFCVDIDQNDLRCDTGYYHVISDGRSDAASADNSDFVAHKSFPAFCRYFSR